MRTNGGGLQGVQLDPATVVADHVRLGRVRISLSDFDATIHTRVDDVVDDPDGDWMHAFSNAVGARAHAPRKPSCGADFGVRYDQRRY